MLPKKKLRPLEGQKQIMSLFTIESNNSRKNSKVCQPATATSSDETVSATSASIQEHLGESSKLRKCYEPWLKMYLWLVYKKEDYMYCKI